MAACFVVGRVVTQRGCRFAKLLTLLLLLHSPPFLAVYNIIIAQNDNCEHCRRFARSIFITV